MNWGPKQTLNFHQPLFVWGSDEGANEIIMTALEPYWDQETEARDDENHAKELLKERLARLFEDE